ncbi:MAG: DUF2934 domain-containing protein [Betaproteobacteria bacterium]|nr:MAG: DUF2934 domain-containing protein [Betaproteobacteria bacterium]
MGIMLSKSISTIKHDSGSLDAEITVSNSVEKSSSVYTKQTLCLAYKLDRHRRIATAAYYRSKQRGFNNGDEIKDWIEAESEIDSVS